MERMSAACQEVVCDFDKGGLWWVLKPDWRRLKELTVGHVVLKMGSHCSFQDFAEERQVGDWTIVVGVVRV